MYSFVFTETPLKNTHTANRTTWCHTMRPVMLIEWKPKIPKIRDFETWKRVLYMYFPRISHIFYTWNVRKLSTREIHVFDVYVTCKICVNSQVFEPCFPIGCWALEKQNLCRLQKQEKKVGKHRNKKILGMLDHSRVDANVQQPIGIYSTHPFK